MARFAVAGRATIAGTSALPLVSLYQTAAVRPRIMEVHLFNTTTTAVTVCLQRLSTTGTQGAGLTEVAENYPEHPPLATAFAGHTVGPTVTAGEIRRATLGAAIGSGIMWTFPDGVHVSPTTGTAATTNGIGVLIPTGAGQVLDYVICWVE